MCTLNPRVREAFDIGQEPAKTRERYGTGEALRLLQARRLVEAGVPVVTLTFGKDVPPCVVGGIAQSWDTHAGNFNCLRHLLPRLDKAVHALVTRGSRSRAAPLDARRAARWPDAQERGRPAINTACPRHRIMTAGDRIANRSPHRRGAIGVGRSGRTWVRRRPSRSHSLFLLDTVSGQTENVRRRVGVGDEQVPAVGVEPPALRRAAQRPLLENLPRRRVQKFQPGRTAAHE